MIAQDALDNHAVNAGIGETAAKDGKGFPCGPDVVLRALCSAVDARQTLLEPEILRRRTLEDGVRIFAAEEDERDLACGVDLGKERLKEERPVRKRGADALGHMSLARAYPWV